MRERLQRSTFKAALSLAAIIASLSFAVASCQAGDKIEFTAPGNRAILEKPEAQIPDDYAAPVESAKTAPRAHRYELQDTGTTIIIPGSDDKHRGLRAWDSSSKLSDLRDQDDPLDRPSDSQTKGAFTNQLNSESEWSLSSTAPHFGGSSFTSPGSTDASSGSGSGYASRGSTGFSPFGKTDRDALELPSLERSRSVWHGDVVAGSSAVGVKGPLTATQAGLDLKAWSLEVTPSSESFMERFQDLYDTRRSSGAPESEVGNPAAAGSIASSAIIGDGGALRAAGLARTAPWVKDSDSGDDSIAASVRNAHGYRAYQALPYEPVAPKMPVAPPMAGSPYTSSDLNLVNQRFAEHPAILPLPKKPGSLFQ